MELSGAALRSWQVLAERLGVPAGALVRAVGVHLLDHEEIAAADIAVVASLARGLDDGSPEGVDLREPEFESVVHALTEAVEAVDRAKRLLEETGHRDAARSLGEAQPSLHDARRLFLASSPPPAS